MEFLIVIGYFTAGILVFICTLFDNDFQYEDKTDRFFICLIFGYFVLIIYLIYLLVKTFIKLWHG